MSTPKNHIFVPCATWRTRRGEVELQRELCCLPRSEDDLRRLIDTGQACPVSMRRRKSSSLRGRQQSSRCNSTSPRRVRHVAQGTKMWFLGVLICENSNL